MRAVETPYPGMTRPAHLQACIATYLGSQQPKGSNMTKRLLVALAAATLGAGLVQGPLATAGAAQPAPTCSGEPATIFFPSAKGSATAVEGTNRDDVIVTGRGQDFVEGKRGRDVICTRGGNDTIRGGRADDQMRGGPGTDRLVGRAGLDRANGGKGDQDVCAAEAKRRCESKFGG